MCRIVTPVVTAFDKNEKPDYEANKKIIDFLIEGGVDGILVLGSSDEFTGMSKEEKYNFSVFMRITQQDGRNSTREREV